MDEKDRLIVKELLKDGRMKIKKIAADLGIPITTVHSRLKNLIKEGIIEVKAKVNKRKMGYGIGAYILVNLDTSSKNVDQEKLMKEISGMKGVEEAAVVTGTTDLVVKAYAKDIDELSDLVLKKLRGKDGVSSTQTLVILKEAKGMEEKFL